VCFVFDPSLNTKGAKDRAEDTKKKRFHAEMQSRRERRRKEKIITTKRTKEDKNAKAGKLSKKTEKKGKWRRKCFEVFFIDC